MEIFTTEKKGGLGIKKKKSTKNSERNKLNNKEDLLYKRVKQDIQVMPQQK